MDWDGLNSSSGSTTDWLGKPESIAHVSKPYFNHLYDELLYVLGT